MCVLHVLQSDLVGTINTLHSMLRLRSCTGRAHQSRTTVNVAVPSQQQSVALALLFVRGHCVSHRSRTMASQRKWMVALRNAGASDAVIRSWRALRDAVAEHQRLLLLNGIGRVADERERVRVNARRVGLEVPPFADEAAVSLQQLLQHAVDERSHESAGHDCQQPRQQQQQQQQQQAQQNVRDAFT